MRGPQQGSIGEQLLWSLPRIRRLEDPGVAHIRRLWETRSTPLENSGMGQLRMQWGGWVLQFQNPMGSVAPGSPSVEVAHEDLPVQTDTIARRVAIAMVLATLATGLSSEIVLRELLRAEGVEMTAGWLLVAALWEVGLAMGFACIFYVGLLRTSLTQISGMTARFLEIVTSAVPRRIRVFCSDPPVIAEVRDLQYSLEALSSALPVFASFLPEAVFQRLVRQELQPLVEVWVTIMFVDIANYTGIAEHMAKKDLHDWLQIYFDSAFSIIKSFQGVIAEILGDGILAFWNTPDTVEAHAAKACAAAVALHSSLLPLNRHLKGLRMPELQTRIGIHTGTVLSGSIGNSSRMKFGCLGDPVNLAARLEALGKTYGVDIICSKDTVGELPEEAGFTCRRLDLVKIRGRTVPVHIYEIICPETLVSSGVTTSSIAPTTEAVPMMTGPIRSDAIDWDSVQLPPMSHWLHPCSSEPNVTCGRDRILPAPHFWQLQYRDLYEAALDFYQNGSFQDAATILAELMTFQPQPQESLSSVHMLLQRVEQQIELRQDRAALLVAQLPV